jgi:hypothetical protein
MDYSNKQASSSPSILDAEMMPPERMPPENGIIDAAIAEMTPLDLTPEYFYHWPDIDPILAAVGPKLVPPNLNRDELRWVLRRDIAKYRYLDEFRSGHLWKNKVAELRELERLSSSARGGNWPLPLPWEAFDRVQEWCKSMLAEIDQGWHPERWHQDLKGKSSIALLVGHILPKTFEMHFGRQAATTPTGPYVRFVMAVLKEFNIKKSNGDDYKRGTIVSELDAARNGYVRHKGLRVSQTTKPAVDIATFVPPHWVVPPF